MKTTVFRFAFDSGVDLLEAETTLRLAILAAEGLVGEARVRLEAPYLVDSPRSMILIDGASPAGAAVIRIFTALITREFDADAFRVERVKGVVASSVGAGARS